jgi:hypothetical protein
MAKCFQGLQYQKTAEDLALESQHIITRLENNPSNIDIDITRLRRIGIDLNDQRADDASHFFSLDQKNFTRQLSILKQKAFYRAGLIMKDADKRRSAATAFTDAIEKCQYYDDQTRRACFQELIDLFTAAGIYSEDLTRMNEVYSKNDREFLFLCAYGIFSPSGTLTKINTVIQEFVSEELDPSADKIGMYSCYEGPMYQLEMVQRDDPREDMIAFCQKFPKSAARIMHPYD